MPSRPIPPPPPPRPDFVPNSDYRPPVLPKHEEEIEPIAENQEAMQSEPQVEVKQEEQVEKKKEKKEKQKKEKEPKHPRDPKESKGALVGTLLMLGGFAFIVAAIVIAVLMFI